MRRSRYLLLVGAILAVAGSTVLAYLSKMPPPNDLRVSPSTTDFGQVRQREVLSAQLTIANSSDAPVEIVRIMSTCDCARSQLSTSRLLPREQVSLDVVWDVGTRRGPSEATITVVTVSDEREAGLQTAQAVLRAEVLPTFTLKPESVSFRRIGGSQKQWISFRQANGYSVELAAAHPTQLALDTELGEDNNGLWVHFDPTRWPADRDAAQVILETTSKLEPQRVLPVVVE